MPNTIFQVLSSWPDELKVEYRQSNLLESFRQLRLGNFKKAELKLLLHESTSVDVNPDESTFLRLLIYLYSADRVGFLQLYPYISWADTSSIFAKIIEVQYRLIIGDLDGFANGDFDWSEPRDCEFLHNSRVAIAISSGDLVFASDSLLAKHAHFSLERTLLQSRLNITLGQYEEAFVSLQAATLRAPNSLLLWISFVDLVFGASDGSNAVKILTKALHFHGEHPSLLSSVSLAKLHSREPALALRAKLNERLKILTNLQTYAPRDANLISAYDHLGRCDWLRHLSSDLKSVHMAHIDLHSNLLMQLSSVEDPNYRFKATEVVDYFTNNPPYKRHLLASPQPLQVTDLPSSDKSSLKILWITGDINNHPVCRFLIGILSAAPRYPLHQHVVVSLQPPNADFKSMMESLPFVQFVDVSSKTADAKTSSIRNLGAHVAVDLSGWTGGHHATALMARVAPVQVNYLGYHASTGIPQVDYWLGDSVLFPHPMNEWHSERIWRLPRPFLSWCPPACLVEANAKITAPPDVSGVRFGCFNHFRKISDACLATWSKILQEVPNSRLVLKGTTCFDGASTELARRRLERQGLSMNQIDWLPLAPSPADHLQQYGTMDVALDCFPNTGCTTTCEALWMGVPVITLSGRNYVSRMSASVLSAAGLTDWITHTEEEYIKKAVDCSKALCALRSNRSQWRECILSSPLGDSSDLFLELEKAFSSMANEVYLRSLSNQQEA